MATIMMSTTTPSSLLPLAKASGRCPPSLIRDEQIIEGGVFEMACLKALDLTSQGELIFFISRCLESRTPGSNVVQRDGGYMKGIVCLSYVVLRFVSPLAVIEGGGMQILSY